MKHTYYFQNSAEIFNMFIKVNKLFIYSNCQCTKELKYCIVVVEIADANIII